MNDTQVLNLVDPITMCGWGRQPERELTQRKKGMTMLKVITAIAIIVALVLCILGLSVPMASAPEPMYGVTTVDGVPGEWTVVVIVRGGTRVKGEQTYTVYRAVV